MTLTRGVFYFNHGVRCLVRLGVSLLTLRRHYTGPVALASEGELPLWFQPIIDKFAVNVIKIPVCHDYGLLKKSRLWRVTPFDVTMFIDADTVIHGPVDQFLDWTEEHGLVVTAFCEWSPGGRRMSGRINEWMRVDRRMARAALKYPSAVNTGVQGWKKGHAALPEYEDLTQRGLKAGVTKKTLDEIAMQLLLPKHKHYLAPDSWNDSCIYGKKESRILHYHGHKHCRANWAGDIWKEEFWHLCEAFPSLREQLTEDPGDASITIWLKEAKRPKGWRKDITIVTAVNPKYAATASQNFKLWMQTPGLKEQDYIVFVNGFKRPRDRAFIQEIMPNARVIRWDYPFQANQRETMLAAFVLGAALHVTTERWLKLDADSKPLKDFVWPDYRGQTIVSHKWGYTKMKGEEAPKEHWFNRLDKIFSPTNPMFKEQLDPVQYFRLSHRPGNRFGIPMRFGSFAHIEKTDFTRKVARFIADMCGGRLPIPSHDTLVWYCATLWKEPVKLVNMKEYLQP